MISRRHMLKRAGAASLAAGFLPALGRFAESASAADVSGYRALVCVFLHGGLDAHDTVLPIDQAAYGTYAQIRSTLIDSYALIEGTAQGATSRALANLLPLQLDNAAAHGGRNYGMPGHLAPLHALFDAGYAAIVGNVGPLIVPTTKTQYDNNQVPLPARLFSHNDQQSTWASFGPEGAQIGWGGRFADAAIASNANTNPIFTAISVSGNNVFLSGSNARQYELGASSIRELDDPSLLGGASSSQRAMALIGEHFRPTPMVWPNRFERDIATASMRSVDTSRVVIDAVAQSTPLQTVFPQSKLGRQLQSVAETIAVRATLGARRQVFLAELGSFDTHSSQAKNLPALQSNLAASLAAFFSATQELGVSDQVTLFTISDFGRTLVVNGDGTDHGWGGHHVVVGGAVDGRKIFGQIPDYNLGHPLDAGHGRLIPQLAVEQYAATLGRWFGLTQGELDAALPGLAAGGFDPFGAPFL